MLPVIDQNDDSGLTHYDEDDEKFDRDWWNVLKANYQSPKLIYDSQCQEVKNADDQAVDADMEMDKLINIIFGTAGGEEELFQFRERFRMY